MGLFNSNKNEKNQKVNKDERKEKKIRSKDKRHENSSLKISPNSIGTTNPMNFFSSPFQQQNSFYSPNGIFSSFIPNYSQQQSNRNPYGNIYFPNLSSFNQFDSMKLSSLPRPMIPLNYSSIYNQPTSIYPTITNSNQQQQIPFSTYSSPMQF